MIGTIQTALSGLFAASKRIEAGASNIANMHTTGALEDGAPAPYKALTTIQETRPDGGVKAGNIPKSTAFVPAYSPDSPFANADGLVGVPNVNLAEEAVNMTLAKTAYKANLKTIQTAADMQDEMIKTLDRKA